jgi:hypothetical protein
MSKAGTYVRQSDNHRFVMLLALSALIYFFALGCQSGPSQQETSETPAASGPDTTTPSEGDNFGSLDGLIQQQVGNFELLQSESAPTEMEVGATDGRIMDYVSTADQAVVIHTLALFPSEDEATSTAQVKVDALISLEGYSLESRFPVIKNGSEEQQSGEGVLLTREHERVIWTNKNLIGDTLSERYADEFYQDLPY